MYYSCSKDDDTNTFIANQSDLTGVWMINNVDFEGVDLDLDDCQRQESITVTNSGSAIWKDPGLGTDVCDFEERSFKFVVFNMNFNVEHKSETTTYHGKFLDSNTIQITVIFKLDELVTKSIYTFRKQ